MCKRCDGCIWFDQCASRRPCEHYSPVDENELDEDFEREYIKDLADRNRLYQRQVEEQDA